MQQNGMASIKKQRHVVSLVATYSCNVRDKVGLRINFLLVQLQTSSACVLPRLSAISSQQLVSTDLSITYRSNMVIRKKKVFSAFASDWRLLFILCLLILQPLPCAQLRYVVTVACFFSLQEKTYLDPYQLLVPLTEANHSVCFTTNKSNVR